MKQFSDRIFKIFTNCSLSRTLSTGEQEALLSKAVPQLHPSAEAVHLGSGAMRNPGDGGIPEGLPSDDVLLAPGVLLVTVQKHAPSHIYI